MIKSYYLCLVAHKNILNLETFDCFGLVLIRVFLLILSTVIKKAIALKIAIVLKKAIAITVAILKIAIVIGKIVISKITILIVIIPRIAIQSKKVVVTKIIVILEIAALKTTIPKIVYLDYLQYC